MKASALIKELIKQELNQVHVALPAKIESYDPKKLRAEVTLLAKKNLEGEEVIIPPIIECPVRVLKAGSFIIRPPYQPGDVVQVLFNEEALDKILITGEPESVEYTRRHALDDAVIIGGLRVEQDPETPDEELNSLYLANFEKDAKIFIDPDGKIRLANDANLAEVIIDPEGNITVNNESNQIEILKDSDINIESSANCNLTITGDVALDCANATVTASGNAILEGSQISLGQGASQPVPLGTVLNTWLSTHMHTGNMGAPTSPPVVGPSGILSTSVKTK